MSLAVMGRYLRQAHQPKERMCGGATFAVPAHIQALLALWSAID